MFTGGASVAVNTTAGGSLSPYLMVERWANQMRDLLIVPSMTWQASLYIHKRKLALYS